MELDMVTKEDYLKVATPKEWREWLTRKASAYAPTNRRYFIFDYCLICKAAEIACRRLGLDPEQNLCSTCMTGRSHNRCIEIPEERRVNLAIERLEAVGLWD